MASLNYVFVGENTNDLNTEYTPLIMPGNATDVNSLLTNVPGQVQEQFNEQGESKNGTWNAPVTPFSKIKNYQLHNLSNQQRIPKQMVNVVNDYSWTISPHSSRKSEIADQTPFIEMKEKFFLVNNLIAQALYTISSTLNIEGFGIVNGIFDSFARESAVFNATDDTTGENLTPTGTVPNEAQGAAEENQNVPSGSAGVGAINSLKGLIGAIPAAYNEISQGQQNFIDIFTKYNNPDLESVLFPYQRLYILGPTGFRYKFPYLNRSVLNQRGAFSDSNSENNITANLTDIVNRGTDFTEAIGGTLRLMQQAGSAKIERAKNYNYPSEGESFEVAFPLYNTQPATYEDIKNNFKLVLLLLYQNLPLRQDKIIVEPPVVYDVTIPGNRREPYCYISSITVNYMGSTRLMRIDTGGIGKVGYSDFESSVNIPEFIETIIPDAYEIRMTLQPMIAHTKNLLFTTIEEEIVRVGKSTINTNPRSRPSNNSFNPGPIMDPMMNPNQMMA